MKTTLLQIFSLLSPFFVSAQNVGINNPNPLFPLTFNANLGDKISLWTDGGPTHYGLGIQGGLLQIFSKAEFDNIGFGFGSSSSFNERVRIINKGDVGMLVNGRIILTNGTIPLHPDYGAGIWLSRADNNGALGFIGVQNNQNMGFYGGPVGWGLTYDAVNSRVGIGTSNPLARLHVEDNNVLFSSTGSIQNPGPPPMHGPGKRMMWYGDKGAFRVGYVDGDQWSQNSIGVYSFASGFNSRAAGFMSTAIGDRTEANGSYSIALGKRAIANGSSSTSIGEETIAKAYGSLTIGVLNDELDNPHGALPDPIDRLFQIGNGDIIGIRRNALTVLRNGNIGIGTTFPTTTLEVAGGILCVTITQTSDSRLKKGIVPLQNSLQKITRLNGYDYYWKNENADSSLQTGVLAQEVQKIFPHLVKENNEGILSVNYSGLIPVLIESIKEQQKQIDELKTLVEKLLKQQSQNPDK